MDMSDLIFSMAIQHAIEKATKRGLVAIITTVSCNGSLTEVRQCTSTDELNSFLSSNRGKFIIITSEGFGVVENKEPFENGLCLN